MKNKKQKTKKLSKRLPKKSKKSASLPTIRRYELDLSEQDFQDIVNCLAFTGISNAYINKDEPFLSRVRFILKHLANNGARLNGEIEFSDSSIEFDRPEDIDLLKLLGGVITH